MHQLAQSTTNASARRAATFLGSAACPGAEWSAAIATRPGTSNHLVRRMPMCVFSLRSSPAKTATITLRGSSPGRLPSVTAMSTTGIIVPRKLKDAHQERGPRARESPAASPPPLSTSNTGETKRSRPARKTQNCRVGSACSTRFGNLKQLLCRRNPEKAVLKCVSLGIRRTASLHAGDLPGQTVNYEAVSRPAARQK